MQGKPQKAMTRAKRSDGDIIDSLRSEASFVFLSGIQRILAKEPPYSETSACGCRSDGTSQIDRVVVFRFGLAVLETNEERVLQTPKGEDRAQ